MEYFTFYSHIGFSWLIGFFFTGILLIIFLGYFFSNINDGPLDDPGSLGFAIFTATFILLYWSPFLLIYPLISWLFIPDYVLRANFITHLAANSFIFFLLFIIYLIRLSYLNSKKHEFSKNSFRLVFLKNKKLLISAILIIIWVSWSVFFILFDVPQAKQIISARSNNLIQKQKLIEDAKTKLKNIKLICFNNNQYKIPNNYKTDSVAIFFLQNDFTCKIINNPNLSYYFEEIDDPDLTLVEAEKIMQTKCVAFVYESSEPTGKVYGVENPIKNYVSRIKAVVYYWQIRLIDIQTEKTTAYIVLKGPEPPETIIDPKDNTEYYGIKPDDEYRAWFASLKFAESKKVN